MNTCKLLTLICLFVVIGCDHAPIVVTTAVPTNQPVVEAAPTPAPKAVPTQTETDIEITPAQIVKVIGIVDGDTIDVLTNDKQQIRIRVNAIDTPEPGQPFGANAKQFVSDAVSGKEVLIIGDERDRYGRLIADVNCLDGDFPKSLSLELSMLVWRGTTKRTRTMNTWQLRR